MPDDAASQASETGALLVRGHTRAVLLGLLVSFLSAMLAATAFRYLPSSALLAPVAGIAVALTRTRPVESAVIAALGALTGSVAGLLLAEPSAAAAMSQWMHAAGATALAGLVAFAVRATDSRVPRSLPVVVALVFVIGASGISAAVHATTPGDAGLSFADNFRYVPTITPDTSDSVLYYHYVLRIKGGESYYDSAVRVLTDANARRPGQLNATTPLSYRMPAMYWLLALLPAHAASYIGITLLFGAAATIAGYALARSLVHPSVAIVSATLVAAFFSGMAASTQLFHTEVWVGALGIACLACFSQALRSQEPDTRLMYAAVVLATSAALVRELAVAFLLVGVVALLAEPATRQRTLYVPWLAGLGVSAAAYAVHVASVRLAIVRLGVPPTPFDRIPWWHGDGLGLVAVIARTASMSNVRVFVAWLLAASAAVGVVVVPRRRAVRIALAACVIGGMTILLFIYPQGRGPDGLPPGYWGYMIAPTVLACSPLLAGLLLRRPKTARHEGHPGTAG